VKIRKELQLINL